MKLIWYVPYTPVPHFSRRDRASEPQLGFARKPQPAEWQRMLLRRDGFKTELDVRVRGDGIIGLDRSITDADIYNTYAVQPKRAPAFLPLVSSITVDIADRSPLPQCNHGQRSATIGLGEAPRRVPQDVHSESRPTCEPKEPR